MPTAVLERAAARNVLDCVAAFERAAPSPGAAAVECAGGVAAFAGRESPLTAIKGAGPRISDCEIECAEEFLRGYRPTGSENVVVRRPSAGTPPAGPAVLAMHPDTWAALMARAFEFPAAAPWLELARASAALAGACNLGAWDPGAGWLAAAQMATAGEVAIFACDATLPSARRQGAQMALIQERLTRASRSGFALAAAEVAPGSASERNYLRAGFRIAATRVHYARVLD